MGDLPSWLQAVSSVVGGVGLAVLVWLLVYGPLGRRSDCDARIDAQRVAHETELALVQSGHADALTALNLAHDNRVRHLTRELEQANADRDAWHDAYTEEAAGRRAAETATQQVMESGNVTMALLSALKDSLARTPPSRRQGGST